MLGGDLVNGALINSKLNYLLNYLNE